LNYTIPIHEIIFYVFVIIWGIIRFKVFGEKEKYGESVNNFTGFYEYNKLLENNNPYFKSLSDKGKHKFVHRTLLIQSELEFQGREDFVITDEVKILISGCIAQLTFGFSNPLIPNLKGVVIFPGIFYSKLSEAWVKGLAMGNGVVFLSWEDFVSGYEPDTATYNLGLHEFAHILRLSVNDSYEDNFRLFHYYDDWEAHGASTFTQIRNAKQDFFREYGGTNQAEFFSVCIENFFEVPQAFCEKFPKVYWHLCFLMQQNPLNVTEDYAFDKEDTEEANMKIVEPMPELNFFLSDFEYKIWQYIETKKYNLIIPLFLSIAFFVLTSYPIDIIRMTIVSITIGAFMRVYFHGSFNIIRNDEYVQFILFKSLPIAFIIAWLPSLITVLIMAKKL
jgi:Mlc titration factor MtfA (ptsG expression regulator)